LNTKFILKGHFEGGGGSAKAILEREERPVAEFQWKEGTNLKTVQVEGEPILREMIQKVKKEILFVNRLFW